MKHLHLNENSVREFARTDNMEVRYRYGHDILVIDESPAKVKTIKKFLGSNMWWLRQMDMSEIFRKVNLV